MAVASFNMALVRARTSQRRLALSSDLVESGLVVDAASDPRDVRRFPPAGDAQPVENVGMAAGARTARRKNAVDQAGVATFARA